MSPQDTQSPVPVDGAGVLGTGDELGTRDVPDGSADDDGGHWQMPHIIYSDGGAGAELFFTQLHEIQPFIRVLMQHRPSKDRLVNSPQDTPFPSGSLPKAGAHLSSFGQGRREQRSHRLQSQHKSDPAGLRGFAEQDLSSAIASRTHGSDQS